MNAPGASRAERGGRSVGGVLVDLLLWLVAISALGYALLEDMRLSHALSRVLGISSEFVIYGLQGLAVCCLVALYVRSRGRGRSYFNGELEYNVRPSRLVGRERDKGTCIDKLKRNSTLILSGPSGSGKSTLCRMGIRAQYEQDGHGDAVYIDLSEMRLQGWQDGPAQMLMERVAPPAATEVNWPDFVARVVKTLAARPDPTLIIFDQFDDYLTQCSAEFFKDIEQQEYYRPHEIAARNRFWGEIKSLLANHKIRCVFVVRKDAEGATDCIKFNQEFSRYTLSGVTTQTVDFLLQDVFERVVDGRPRIENADKGGWKELRARILTDFGASDVLPQRVVTFMNGLRYMRPLTISEYARRGGLLGIEALFIDEAVKQVARNCDIDEEVVLRVLRAMIRAEERRRILAVPLGAAIAAASPGVDATVVQKLLDDLLLHRILIRTPEGAWQLAHDYLCDVILHCIRRRADHSRMRLEIEARMRVVESALGSRLRRLLEWRRAVLHPVTVLSGLPDLSTWRAYPGIVAGNVVFWSLVAVAGQWLLSTPLHYFNVRDAGVFNDRVYSYLAHSRFDMATELVVQYRHTRWGAIATDGFVRDTFEPTPERAGVTEVVMKRPHKFLAVMETLGVDEYRRFVAGLYARDATSAASVRETRVLRLSATGILGASDWQWDDEKMRADFFEFMGGPGRRCERTADEPGAEPACRELFARRLVYSTRFDESLALRVFGDLYRYALDIPDSERGTPRSRWTVHIARELVREIVGGVTASGEPRNDEEAELRGLPQPLRRRLTLRLVHLVDAFEGGGLDTDAAKFARATREELYRGISEEYSQRREWDEILKSAARSRAEGADVPLSCEQIVVLSRWPRMVGADGDRAYEDVLATLARGRCEGPAFGFVEQSIAGERQLVPRRQLVERALGVLGTSRYPVAIRAFAVVWNESEKDEVGLREFVAERRILEPLERTGDPISKTSRLLLIEAGFILGIGGPDSGFSEAIEARFRERVVALVTSIEFLGGPAQVRSFFAILGFVRSDKWHVRGILGAEVVVQALERLKCRGDGCESVLKDIRAAKDTWSEP